MRLGSALFARRGYVGGGHHGHAKPAVDPKMPPPPPEGKIPEPPENEQYLFQPNFVYRNKLPEEAELYDAQSMTPDVDTHVNPAMAVRHLLMALGGLGVFGMFLYTVQPPKPTNVRDLPWKQVDEDYGGYLGFAEGKTTKEFRG